MLVDQLGFLKIRGKGRERKRKEGKRKGRKEEEFFVYSIIAEIAGIVIIMLALFNYLEAELK